MKATTLLSDIMAVLNGDRKIVTQDGYHQIEVHETQLDDFNKRFEEAVKEIAPTPEPKKATPKKKVKKAMPPKPNPHEVTPMPASVASALSVINGYIDGGRKINAIKEIREQLQCGLKEAKEMEEMWSTGGEREFIRTAKEILERNRLEEEIDEELDFGDDW